MGPRNTISICRRPTAGEPLRRYLRALPLSNKTLHGAAMNSTDETPAKPPKRLGRRIWRIFRIVWIAAGIAFTLWLYDSFRARGIDEKTLQSNAQITVADTDEAIVFTPTEPTGPMGLLFFHGAGVEPSAYAPLIRAVAENGFIAAIVKLPYRVAPFKSHRREAISRAQQIVAQTEAVDKWVVAGHSKGGKIAAELVHADRSLVSALILIATSHPKDFDLSNIVIPVKKVFASNDGIATVEMIESTKRNLPEHTQWIEIVGGNHSQFGYYGHQFLDGHATIDRTEQQRRTLEEILATLESLQISKR